MNTSRVILRSTFLAASIFWIIIFSENFEHIMILLFFLSIIPISICCAITILITILPFFWFKKDGTSPQSIFNSYFPYYAIAMFSICLYGVWKEPEVISFFVSAFLTTMQAWVWFGKKNKAKQV